MVITVQDHDRFLAAQMVNEIVNKIDQTNRDLLNDNKKKILEIYKNKMKDKEEAKPVSVLTGVVGLRHGPYVFSRNFWKKVPQRVIAP